MANYQILKADIDEKIYENAQQKITGANLNSVLNEMVATLGAEYQFAGVATIDTNPETSDAKVFYIANGKGTYTNFGGINVTEDNVVILYYDTSWHKVATGIASNEKLSELDSKIDELNANIYHKEFVDCLISNKAISQDEGYMIDYNGVSLLFMPVIGKLKVISDKEVSMFYYYSGYPDTKYPSSNFISSTLGEAPNNAKYVIIQFNNKPTTIFVEQNDNELVGKDYVDDVVADLPKSNQYKETFLGKSDLEIQDESGYSIVRFLDGEIVTKNFDSSIVKAENPKEQKENADFDISDKNGYSILQVKNGHIKTKNFDSSNISSNDEPFLLHIVLTGQSLSNGTNGNDLTVLPIAPNTKKALMFAHVKTFDMGYNFGATPNDYNANQEYYDNLLYGTVNHLKEEIGYTQATNTKWWDIAAYARCETPSSGIVEGILNMCKAHGMPDMPFYTLSTCSGVGGISIDKFLEGEDIYCRTMQDIRHGIALAGKMGLAYRVALVYMQGEQDLANNMSQVEYKNKFESMFNSYKAALNKMGIDNAIKIYTYQPTSTYVNRSNMQSAALAMMELNNQYTWFKMCYPNYNIRHNPGDGYIHLFKESYRQLGNSVGYAIFQDLYGEFETIKIDEVQRDGNNLLVKFNKKYKIDESHIDNEYRTTFTDSENAMLSSCKGFKALDGNGVSVSTSVEVVNDMCIRVICSNAPTKLVYGYDPKSTGVTIGGYIREDFVGKGYKGESDVYLYMPIQEITSFTEKHVYTLTSNDSLEM